jgi:hypothetical protein
LFMYRQNQYNIFYLSAVKLEDCEIKQRTQQY